MMIPTGIDLARLPRTAEQFWKLVALVGFAGFAFGHWWQGLLTIGAALICLWSHITGCCWISGSGS